VSRLRSAAANLALAAVSVMVVLLLAEAALRILARGRAGGKEQRERHRYTEYDPVLGWRKTPGARVVYDRREYHVEFTLNAHGLRGPDLPEARTPGAARVLALGDSFVEAFMVPDGETVTDRLQQALGEAECRAEVVNGGTVGYSTDQEYLFFRDEGRRYAADAVVLFVYHNDIPYLLLDEYLGYPKPRLDFAASPPAVANQPVPRYEPAAAPAPPPAGEATATSYVAELVKDSLERTSARTYNRLADLGLWERRRTLPLNEEMQLYRQPELGHLRPAWSAFTWTLQTLAAEVSRAGGRLLVAYVPSRMEVSASTWELTQARYALDPAYDRAAVAARVRYIAGRLGLPLLDLTAPLTEAARPLRATYFKTDSHWNARGQAVAGRAVADFLRAERLLPGSR
jgi:hypothetical protein